MTPFTVTVPQPVLDDLRRRLAATRWPDTLDGSAWSLGMDLAYLRELVAYWRDGFDWRGVERRVNALPQYRIVVRGLGLHLLHVRGRGPSPLPLVITHGWPGSFLEMLKLVPLLADPAAHGGNAADCFDVVVPSLPGYGFSDRPRSPGVGNRHVAGLWTELMTRLGYDRFGAQGGDWGAGIGTWLALDHPERLVGLHLNYVPGSYEPFLDPADPLTSAEKAFLESREEWLREDGAYGHLQATRPQTLGVALNDSPAGLAAWIVEKFREWSDCGGDLERRFTKDELLANVTLYWVTETIHSSVRLYRESGATPLRLRRGERVRVPTAVARFPGEAPSPPREWVERGYDLVRWTEMPRGGHFAAMEEPELLAEDVRAFFRPLRAARP